MSLLYNRLMKISHVNVLKGKMIVVKFQYPWGANTGPIRDWCNETFGLPGNKVKENIRWNDYLQWGEITFRYESDVTLFLLRWS